MNALAYVASQPWLIEPEWLETIAAIADRVDPAQIVARIAAREGTTPEAVAARVGTPMHGTRAAVRRGPVCVVSLNGPIVRHAGLFSEISGATSLGTLATDIQAAVDDPKVDAIVLHIDSPGGEATGIADAAKLIRSGSAIKPICAFVEGYGASAAYWLAAACSEVVCSDSAILGSIGAVLSVNPRNKKEITIVSRQSPRKRLDPTSESGQAAMQEVMDDLAQVFIDAVADYRDVTPQEVMDRFGKGGTMIGRRAVEAGMADRIGTLESLIQDLSGGHRARPGMPATAPGQVPVSTNEVKMSLYDKMVAFFGADSASEVSAALVQPQSNPAASAGTLLVSPDRALAEKLANAEAEIARLKAGDDIKTSLRTGFEAYVGTLKDRVTPAETSLCVDGLVQAALDDRANPLEGFRRVDAFKAVLEKRTAHQLTEVLSGSGDEIPAVPGFKVVSPAPDAPKDGQADQQRVDSLLAMTSTGRQVLATRKAK